MSLRPCRPVLAGCRRCVTATLVPWVCPVGLRIPTNVTATLQPTTACGHAGLADCISSRLQRTVTLAGGAGTAFHSSSRAQDFPLDRCVICNRPITKGDFALEHQMYSAKDSEKDADQVVVKRVRTFPRLWCFNCSIENAKGAFLCLPSSSLPR